MAGQWFSLSYLVSSTNKTDRHNITVINIVESGIKHHKPTYILHFFFRHSVDLFLDFINIFRKLMIILAKKVCTLMCSVYITVIMSTVYINVIMCIVSDDVMVRVLMSSAVYLVF